MFVNAFLSELWQTAELIEQEMQMLQIKPFFVKLLIKNKKYCEKSSKSCRKCIKNLDKKIVK